MEEFSDCLEEVWIPVVWGFYHLDVIQIEFIIWIQAGKGADNSIVEFFIGIQRKFLILCSWMLSQILFFLIGFQHITVLF